MATHFQSQEYIKAFKRAKENKPVKRMYKYICKNRKCKKYNQTQSSIYKKTQVYCKYCDGFAKSVIIKKLLGEYKKK